MELSANDFMTREVFCITTATTLQDIAELIVSKRIGGVPVIDESGKLVGVVSKTDLLTHGLEPELQSLLNDKSKKEMVKELFDFDNLLGPEPSKITVEQIMQTQVVTAPKETKITKLVKMMLEHKIHRIVITEKDRVIGIVTTMDILRMIDTDE